MTAQFDRQGFMRGVRASYAIALGIIAYGVVFGMVAVQRGLSVTESMMLSGFVFAGASQFVALDLWGPNLPVAALIATTFVVNMRHMLMGASISPWFNGLSPAKKYGSAFFMVDESWALSMDDLGRGGSNAAFMLGSGVFLYFCWNAATYVGANLAGSVGDPAQYGLDFSFCAVFLAILAGMCRGRSDILPWGMAALAALLGNAYLPGKWYILMGGLAAGITEALRHDK